MLLSTQETGALEPLSSGIGQNKLNYLGSYQFSLVGILKGAGGIIGTWPWVVKNNVTVLFKTLEAKAEAWSRKGWEETDQSLFEEKIFVSGMPGFINEKQHN